MAYTPTTWTTGDTITASAMNKIEQGIAGAGGGNPVITFNFSGFGNYSTFWDFAIGELDNGVYVAKKLANYGGEVLAELFIGAPNGEYIWYCPFSVPKEEDWALLFLRPNTDTYSTTVSGNISQTTVTLNYGTIGYAYIITGDCTINITAL